MRAEIITIGDELCRGEIVNTNASWLASALWEMQITVTHIVTCLDLIEDIAAAIKNAVQRSDVVIVGGGLGPTLDDLTVDVLCQLTNREAVPHVASLERMKQRFEDRGMPLADNALRQVRIPKGAQAFDNSAGLAPGFEVKMGTTFVYCLPGPPRELKAIFTEHMSARLGQLRRDGGEVEHLARKKFRVFGKGESNIASALAGMHMPEGASLHYQVSFPETLVKVVVRDNDAARADITLQAIDSEITKRLGSWIYGVDDDSLSAVLGRMLSERGQSIASAESCTGGRIAALLTDVPGSSEYVLGGVVTYANREKTRQLGVSEATLETYGAVSEETVVQMVRGLRERSGVDWAVATSGIAGPGGGSEDKPVGTVWIAAEGPAGQHFAKKYFWPGSRDQVRSLASYWALNAVRKLLQEETS